MEGQSRPLKPEAMPISDGDQPIIIMVMSLLQKREAAAGSIIRPTASSVPSAWNPPTRFRTTRPRKIRCVGVPARLTERRKIGSTHSSTSGR